MCALAAIGGRFGGAQRKQLMRSVDGMIEAFLEKWPVVLVSIGLALFAAACVRGAQPEWTLYIGPALMLAGVMMIIRQQN